MNHLEPSVFNFSQESDEISSFNQVSDEDNYGFWGFEAASPMFGQSSAGGGGGANKRKHAFQDIATTTTDSGANEKGNKQKRKKKKKKVRCAATHSLNERLRRQQFRAKIEVLRELIPNSTKKDQASTIDDAVAYIKMLQCQQVQPKPMGTCYSNMCLSPSMGTYFITCQCHSPLMKTALVQIPNYLPTFLPEMGMGMGTGTGMPGMFSGTGTGMPGMFPGTGTGMPGMFPGTGTGMPGMFPSANHPMVTNQLDQITPGMLPEMLDDAAQNVGIDNVLEPFNLTNDEINEESLGWGNI